MPVDCKKIYRPVSQRACPILDNRNKPGANPLAAILVAHNESAKPRALIFSILKLLFPQRRRSQNLSIIMSDPGYWQFVSI